MLLAHVIEIEHAKVPLAAIDAGMFVKVRGHRLAGGLRPPSARVRRLLAVLRAALPEVVAEAVATPVLDAGTRAVERSPRKVSLASSALLVLQAHEHMFASASDDAEH